MKAFIYEGDIYLRVIPVKRMFQSTMVHDVVTRGDVFAVRMKDSSFTVIPGSANVIHLDIEFTVAEKG